MKASLLSLMTLVFCSTWAHAAELTLFDLPLRSATRADLRAAVEHAGGRLISTSASDDLYDATKIGLPAATRLEVVYLGTRFVLAQYQFPEYSETDEKLRKMITSKYGQPTKQKSFMGSASAFDGQYIQDGKYTWVFSDAMQLVFDKPFNGNRTLSYVDREAQAQLAQLLNSRQNEQAATAAKKQSSVF